MTFIELLNTLIECGDVDLWKHKNYIDVIVNDFEGFSENWEEIERDFVKPDLVEQLIKYFPSTRGLYSWRTIDNTMYCLGFSSYDI